MIDTKGNALPTPFTHDRNKKRIRIEDLTITYFYIFQVMGSGKKIINCQDGRRFLAYFINK